MVKREFTSLCNELRDIIVERKQIKDVFLMAELGFSPETWRHWRTQFVEWFKEMHVKKEEDNEKFVKEEILYDKKQKLWYVKETPITN